MAVLNLKSEYWAYDLSPQIITKGEVFDQEAINTSIELILSTFFGERFFNLSYGSNLPVQIHELMNKNTGEKLVEDIITSIQNNEDRILVDRENVQFKFSSSQGILDINIPYIVLKQKVYTFFSKKILI
jgi:phage baseplate assembly protein W